MFGFKPRHDRSGKISRSLRLESLEARNMLNAAPVVCDLAIIRNDLGVWVASGYVVDADDSVEGDVVTFGYALSGYSTTACADGSFVLAISANLMPGQAAIASTVDPRGALSNVASTTLIA